jgi:hypothetical protein
VALDWIKIRIDLPDQPEVVGMARRLNLDIDTVVGKLLRVWAWADAVTTDGNIPHVDAAYVDDKVKCPGFTDAMAAVSWIRVKNSGISFPNFDRHNGKSAKKRAEDSQRKTNARNDNGKPVRNLSAKCPQENGQKPDQRREEKRREEEPLRGSQIQNAYADPSADAPEPAPAPPPPDSPHPGQTWPSFLATEWAFHFAGTAKSERNLDALSRFFADLIASGNPPTDILNSIREPTRPRRQPTWEFERAYYPTQRAAPAKPDPFAWMKDFVSGGDETVTVTAEVQP